MNTKNIRFRILFWCSLTLFIATAIIFSSFYFVTRQILFAQVDKELALHAGDISKYDLTNPHITSEFVNVPGMVVTILDASGSIVTSSLSLDTPFVSYKYLFDQVKNSPNSIYVNQAVNNVPMRFIAVPIMTSSNLSRIILIAHPIDAIQKSLNTLLITLGIVFAALIIPTILAVRVLASKIMQPILEISDKMEKINSEQLDERVDNPKSHDEIEKLAVTFNGLLDRLQSSFDRERQFIGDVAHELKTPIATLRSGIEIALSKERTIAEYKKELTETLIDVNRLSGVIKNVLDLAWMGIESSTSFINEFNLSEVLIDITEIETKLSSEKQITVRSKIDPKILIKGNKDKITRAILNVIDNAIKYTSRNGEVSISLYKKSKNVIVEVKDNGIGISTEELPHVFERFYRGSKTEKNIGSGLGLAIAQNIVKAHGGDIKVTSVAGKGTNVRILMKS